MTNQRTIYMLAVTWMMAVGWHRALAQPPVPAPPKTDFASDRKALFEMLQRVKPLETSSPSEALNAYRAFLEAHPGMDSRLTVDLVSFTIDVLYFQLRQADAALQLCDQTFEKYRDDPVGKRYVVRTLTDKARVLVAEKRPAEAQALIEKEWDRVMAGWGETVPRALQQYCAALEAQGKGTEASKAVRKALTTNPDCLQELWQGPHASTCGWMYARIANDLMTRGQYEDALRWAKLDWLTAMPGNCVPGTGRPTLLLQRIWTMKDMSDRNAKAFEKAITDPSAPNPLADVKLPDNDTKAYTDRLERSDLFDTDREGHLNALIALGKMSEAMTLARQWYVESPTALHVEFIHRLLKAGYLNLKVIEDFENFRKTGQGTNPMDEFARKFAPAEDENDEGVGKQPEGAQK